MTKPRKFSSEMAERAVRQVFDTVDQHASQWAAIQSVAAQIGCTTETLRRWVRQAECDQGLRASPSADTLLRVKALEREVRELRRENKILRCQRAAA